eukprot:3773914-Pyramimonas_sp.AAC.1
MEGLTPEPKWLRMCQSNRTSWRICKASNTPVQCNQSSEASIQSIHGRLYRYPTSLLATGGLDASSLFQQPLFPFRE